MTNDIFSTPYVDLKVASITMLITLIIAAGHAIYAFHNSDPLITILAFCKLRYYIIQSTSMMYRWNLSAACFDRYALSSAKARLRNFSTVHIARRISISIVCLWIVLPIHTLIFHTIKSGLCGPFYSSATALYHSIFTTINGCIIPILLMTIFILLTYRNLLLKQKRLKLTRQQNAHDTNKIEHNYRARDHQVLIILLIQVILYILGTTPLMFWLFYNAITFNVTNKSIDRLAIERFIGVMIEFLVNAYPVLACYIYTTASHTFRNELIHIFRFVISCRFWNICNRIVPINE